MNREKELGGQARRAFARGARGPSRLVSADERGERSEQAGPSWICATSEGGGASGASGAGRLRSEATGSSRLSAASRLVRAKRAGCFALARRGERSQWAGSSWLSAASEASRLVRMAQRSERSERAGSGWLSSASDASRRVGAGSARSEASGLVRAGSARRAERADGFELAQRGERSERAGSRWLSAASGASRLASLPVVHVDDAVCEDRLPATKRLRQ